MPSEISLIVYGEPVAQARPRFRHVKTKEGREFNQTYDPKKSGAFKDRVYDQAIDVKPDKPIDGPVTLIVTVYRSIPKSMPKYKQALALAGRLKPTTKPDLDNYIKGIKDALRGVIWTDDARVTDTVQGKRYSDTPRVEIKIKEDGCI